MIKIEKGYYKGQIKDEVNNRVIKITKAVAEYDNIIEPDNRYYLEITLDNNGSKRILTVILFNPSESAINEERSSMKNKPIDLTKAGKKKTFIDGTITNVIKIAAHCGYSKIIVLNLFSTIKSKPKDIISNPVNFINEYNNSKIKKILQDKNDILIAWGSNSKKDIKTIKANLTSEIQGSFKYFYRNEKSNTPTHPSPYNNEKVKSFLKNENELKSFINLHADS